MALKLLVFLMHLQTLNLIKATQLVIIIYLMNVYIISPTIITTHSIMYFYSTVGNSVIIFLPIVPNGASLMTDQKSLHQSLEYNIWRQHWLLQIALAHLLLTAYGF